jgi:hypothetical protein
VIQFRIQPSAETYTTNLTGSKLNFVIGRGLCPESAGKGSKPEVTTRGDYGIFSAGMVVGYKYASRKAS